MGSLWATLAPFAIAAALMPIELVITLALLGTPGRVRTATAAVAGTVLVRLLQGLVFGAVLHWGRRDDTPGGHGWLVSSVILVVGIILLVNAIREFFGGDDPDGPPPKWMAALSTMSAGKALLLGGATVLISVKMWVFTFAAISGIGDAGMQRSANWATYTAFVVLGVSTHLVIIAAAAFFPKRSAAFLDGSLRWLQDHNRVIMIALGLLFGSWFLYKGLGGLGVF